MIRRLRKFILITGTTLSVLIVAAFVVSGNWVVAVQIRTPYGPCLALRNGSALALFYDALDDLTYTESISPWPGDWGQWNDWSFQPGDGGQVPLYALFLAAAVPVLLVWRFWPKPIKPGHCRCGYDLTGNTSGVCPECGVEVQA